MTDDGPIANTAKELQKRIELAIQANPNSRVFVGPPIRNLMKNGELVSLFLFLVQVNAALRNEAHLENLPSANQPARLVESLPVDLQFLITVFRTEGVELNELTRLGRIVRRLHEDPVLGGANMFGQTVRVSPEPYSLEDVNRVWSLFPPAEDVRASMIYLASPVFIEAGSPLAGAPVIEHKQRFRVEEGAQSRFGAIDRESAGAPS